MYGEVAWDGRCYVLVVIGECRHKEEEYGDSTIERWLALNILLIMR